MNAAAAAAAVTMVTVYQHVLTRGCTVCLELISAGDGSSVFIIQREFRLFGFTLRLVLVVFTRSDITRPKVNRFG